jgi:thiol-disulfide isomerase/thioredoxin
MTKSGTRVLIAILFSATALTLVGVVLLGGTLLRVLLPGTPTIASSGPLAPLDWYVTDIETGDEIHMEEYFGDVLVLTFWATWCPPCRTEKPVLNRLHEAMAERGVRVLAVSVMEEPSMVRRYMQEHGYTLPVAISSGALPEEFNVRGLPTTFVINSEGEIVLRRVGAYTGWDSEVMQKQLEALLPPITETASES